MSSGANSQRCVAILACLLLAGCHIEAKTTNLNTVIECVSDSGSFTYNTSNAKVLFGIGTETMIQLTDSQGWGRTMSASEISKWKCREVK